MIRHVALFRWRDDVTADDIAAVVAALGAMAATVPEIRDYRHGPDLGLGAPRWDYAVVADFDDEAGWQAYDRHPEHARVRSDVIGPLAEERASVQLDL